MPTTINFTPPVDCTVSVTAMFDAAAGGNATDFGGGSSVSIYLTQNNNLYSNSSQLLSVARARYGLQDRFSVVAGQPVVVGVQGNASINKRVTMWNINLKAEVIKR